ncbi:MAG: PHP domain-containing protein [Acidimicrobiales bacterium]
MEPLEALERVAYLQDRGLLPTQKTAAFLKAADVVRNLPEGELETRVMAGTLTDLPGIGASTGEVIVQAMQGRVPDRIARLEDETRIPLGHGGAAGRHQGRLPHALHLERRRGIDRHHGPGRERPRPPVPRGHRPLPRLTVAHGLNRDRLLAQLDEIAALNEELAPFRILTGIEVDILVDGQLDQDEDLLEQLDVVVASVHSKLGMDAPHMTERIVKAVASPHVDILGHCTGRKVKGSGASLREIRARSDYDTQLVFDACFAYGTAVEINCRPERQDPPPELLDQALDAGCLISIDTDAHSPGHLEFLSYGCDKAVAHGISADRIVNTWSADDLLAWTSARRAA